MNPPNSLMFISNRKECGTLFFLVLRSVDGKPSLEEGTLPSGIYTIPPVIQALSPANSDVLKSLNIQSLRGKLIVFDAESKEVDFITTEQYESLVGL